MSQELYIPEQMELTAEQMYEIKQVFDHFDKNGDGKLSFDEAVLFMYSYNIDQIFTKIAFEICDINNDNTISFEEFNLLLILLGDLEEDQSIIYKNMFDKFDIDHNGFLCKKESEQFFKFIFKDISNNRISFYSEYFDNDHDGYLDFKDVVNILNILTSKRN